MRDDHEPRFLLALLERVVPDSEPLAGDLLEEWRARRRSTLWLWAQIVAAIVDAWGTHGGEIRPLRLVDLQPAEASERSRRWTLRFRPLNPSGSPVAGIGGLSLAIFVCLMTVVAPGVWWLFVASAFAGVVLGVAMIVMRSGRRQPC